LNEERSYEDYMQAYYWDRFRKEIAPIRKTEKSLHFLNKESNQKYTQIWIIF